MNPINRMLKQGSQGDDVARLHSQLVHLGYKISDDEVAKKFFGDLTSKLVRQFQGEHGLKATGEVDEATAKRIQAEINSKEPQLEQVTVSGRVTFSEGRPANNVELRVVRKEPVGETQVGTTRTSPSGDYKLTYTRQSSAAGVQVVVNLLGAQGQIIATESVPEKTPLIVVNLTILEQPRKQEFLIHGRVESTDGRALAEIKVQAFDRDLRSEQQLESAVSDNAGHYEIRYGADQFQQAEKESADLVFRLFAPSGELLTAVAAANEQGQPLANITGPGGSGGEEGKRLDVPIVFNARVEETVDFVVESTAFPSEYERFITELRPVLAGVSLADLTSADVEFLSGETRI